MEFIEKMSEEYPSVARELLKAAAAVLALVAAYLLLQLGLLGWVALAACAALASALWKIFSGTGDDAEPKINCPACGAPNPPDRATCKHCDEPF